MQNQNRRRPIPQSAPHSTRRTAKKSKKRLWFTIGGVLILLIAIASSQDKRPASQQTTGQSIEQKAEDQSVANAPSQSDEEYIEKVVLEAVNKNFAKSDENTIDYSPANKSVVIRCIGSDNLSNDWIKKGMWIDIEDTLKEARDLDFEEVEFNILFPLVDTYGNSSNEVVMKAGFSKEVLRKINWENFISDNIPKVASSYWEHGALSR
jgi:hypothetical protein